MRSSVQHRELYTISWDRQTMMEDNMRKDNVCVCVCVCVTTQYSRNWYNTEYQLHFNNYIYYIYIKKNEIAYS